MAEKKITPKAAASKTSKSSKEPATRVTKKVARKRSLKRAMH